MNRQTKVLAIVILMVLLLAIFAGCSTKLGKNDKSVNTNNLAEGVKTNKQTEVYPENGLPKNENVTLKVAMVESGNGKEFKEFAGNSFMKRFPNVKLEMDFSPQISTMIDAKIQSNIVKDMYDIIEYDSPDVLIKSGKLEPQDDLWKRSPYDTPNVTMKELSNNVYYETSFDSGWPDGKKHVSAFPVMGGTGGGMYFNKKLFEEKGWNQDPKTWEEFVTLCANIKKDGIDPIVFPGVYPDYLDLAFGSKQFEIANINGNLDNYTKSYRNWEGAQFTAPEFVEKWKKISELGKKGYFANGIAALNHTQSQMKVLQGKAAMVATGTWVGNEMQDATPKGFEWGYLNVPMGNDPKQPSWIKTTSGFGFRIWAAKPDLNKKWAKEFILWMTNMNIQEMMAEKGGVIPSIRKDYMDDKGRVSKIQPAPRAYLEYTQNHNVRFESNQREFLLDDPTYQQAMKKYNEAIVPMATGKQDPEEVLKEVENLVQKSIKNRSNQ